MIHLIMCGCTLAFLIVCFVFCFVPVYESESLEIAKSLKQVVIKNSILDSISKPEALLCFIFAILSIILALMVFIIACLKYKRSWVEYVFNIVAMIIILLFTIFVFWSFQSLITDEVSYYNSSSYYYSPSLIIRHTNHLVSFILLIGFSVVALMCNIFSFIIKTILNGKEKSLLKGNIEMLERLYLLKAKGIITEEDYNEKRKDFIDKPTTV